MQIQVDPILCDTEILYKKANSTITIYTILGIILGILLGYLLGNMLFIEFENSQFKSTPSKSQVSVFTFLGIFVAIACGFFVCKLLHRTKSDTIFFILALVFAFGILGYYLDVSVAASPSPSYGYYKSPSKDSRQLFWMVTSTIGAIGGGFIGFMLGQQKALFLKLQIEMSLSLKKLEKKILLDEGSKRIYDI